MSLALRLAGFLLVPLLLVFAEARIGRRAVSTPMKPSPSPSKATAKSPPPPPKATAKSPPPPPPVLPGAKRVQAFLSFLDGKGFTKFTALARSTGFNESLRATIAGFNVTVFVPNNAALSVPLPSSQSKLKQILLFHSSFVLRNLKDLQALPKGHELLSLDPTSATATTSYQKSYKLNTAKLLFNGRVTDSAGAGILDNDIYFDVDKTTKKGFTVHVVDKVMSPGVVY